MKKALILLIAALILMGPVKAMAALQCVTYAREASGINLKGDAWQWWNAAQGVYERGNRPKEGAVLVFNRQGNMHFGHVSVVTKVVDKRTLLVNHANWAPHRSADRGRVAEAVPVIDVSDRNDWSEVRVWFRPNNEYGSRTYRTQGFVSRPQPQVMQASLHTEAKTAALEPEKPRSAETSVTARPTAPATEKATAAIAVVTTQPAAPAASDKGARIEAAVANIPAPVAAIAAPAPPAAGRAFDPNEWAEQA